MRATPRIGSFFAFLAVLVLLAGCSRGPTRQINPPRASIQQLQVQADGQWLLTMRLQNFSNVSTRFASVNAQLVVGGQDAGAVVLSPTLTVGPESADVLTATLRPATGAKLVIASALAAGQPVRYALHGKIATAEPSGSYDFSFDSTLNPAPGLTGVMR